MKTSVRLLIAAFVIAAAFITLHTGTSAQGERSNRQKQENKFRKSKRPVRDHYIVVLRREIPAEEVEAVANELLAKHGGTVRHIYTRVLRGFSIQMPEAAAMALSHNPKVDYVEEDSEVNVAKTERASRWNLDRIDQRSLLPLSQSYYYPNVENGAGVNVYILDSGIRLSHREFSNPDGSGNRASLDVDFVNWDGQNGNDCTGHGTAVAGVVGGNTFGVAKGARLHAVRIFGCTDWTMISTIVAGVDWVTAHHVKPAVVNMSLGIPGWLVSDTFDNIIRESIAAGITYVVAAGNDGVVIDNSPARIPEVITVGASLHDDGLDHKADFSNFGPRVDLFAPGVGIVSASHLDLDGNGIFDDPTVGIQGTSFSSPHVAGVAARFLQVVPNAAPAAVQGAIVNAATPNVLNGIGEGSPNLLLFADVRHAFLGQNILPISEGTFGEDSGIDIGPGQWLAMTGSGEIWPGVPFSYNTGPQGWFEYQNGPNFPLPADPPYSLIGTLNDQSFYIGTSNYVSQNLPAPARLFLRTNDDMPGDGNGAFTCKLELWKDLPEARADFIYHSVPTTMLPGETAAVAITMKNVGPTPWTAGQSFKLGSQGDSMTWGINRVVVPFDVQPGSLVTFMFNITAPTVPGTYNFQWRMLQEGVQRFGDVTTNVPITVLTLTNQAQFISQTVPGIMYATETYTVSITMKNVGNTVWSAGSVYKLGSQNPQDNTTWGMNRVTLPHTVYPGQQVTFTFEVMAPLKTGNTNFQWKMVQEWVEWFGAATQNVVVAVKPHPCPDC